MIVRILLPVLLLAGCSLPQKIAADASASMLEGLVRAIERQPDAQLVEQGLPSILLLIDGLLETDPENERLLFAATAAYSNYCQAFLSDEADQERAIKLYARAHEYGLRLLEQIPDMEGATQGEHEAFIAAVAELDESAAPALHIVGAAWLGRIIADSDSMEVLAQLPRAIAVAKRALELDEDYGNGSGHLVFAVYYAAQPRGAGQDLDRSRSHFHRAIELSGTGRLLPRVLYGEFIGRATLDEEFFTKTLEEVLEVDLAEYPETRFFNELARARAQSLLDQREEIF